MRAASALSPGPRKVNCGSPSGGRGARPRRHQEEPTAPQLHAKAPGAAGGGECREKELRPLGRQRLPPPAAPGRGGAQPKEAGGEPRRAGRTGARSRARPRASEGPSGRRATGEPAREPRSRAGDGPKARRSERASDHPGAAAWGAGRGRSATGGQQPAGRSRHAAKKGPDGNRPGRPHSI